MLQLGQPNPSTCEADLSLLGASFLKSVTSAISPSGDAVKRPALLPTGKRP
jgi:hypothetical protein